jgi:gamma-glutamyl-gamma-aminobutyrate hydrolase PuuD
MYRQTTSWWSWERDAALVPGVYLDALEVVGAQPVLIPPRGMGSPAADGPSQSPGVEALVNVLDGLLLIGGGDVDASRYGRSSSDHNRGSSERRDEVELAALDAALRRDLPVLAVCRGMQLLNVSLGGDLVQHLPDRLGSERHQPRPGAFGEITVTTKPDSVVSRLVGETTEVLCSHHQAVGTLGRDLVVTATSDDEVIEAVELPGHRFVVGVQWHPEESADCRLFAGLVDAARGSGRHRR